MAISRRKPKPGLVHHSDRGSQFTSIAIGRTLRDSKIMASMGSKGDPWDNDFYNPLRRHSSLNMLSLNDYERRYREDNTAAAAA